MPSNQRKPDPRSAEALSIGSRFAQLGIEAVKTACQVELNVGHPETVLTTWQDAQGTVEAGQVAVEIEFGFNLGMSLRSVTFIDKRLLGAALGLPEEAVQAGQALSAEEMDLLAESIDQLLQAAQSCASTYFPAQGNDMPFALQLVSLTDDPEQYPAWLPFGEMIKLSHLVFLPTGGGAVVTHLVSSEILTALGGESNQVSAQPAVGSKDKAGAKDKKQASKVISLVDEVLNGEPSESFGASRRDTAPGVTVRPAEFAPLAPMADSGNPQSIDLILDVALKVTVELGRATMSIKEILALGPGSVIELDKLAGEAVDINVNNRLIARGEVVVVDENFGVRVTEIITTAKRNAAVV